MFRPAKYETEIRWLECLNASSEVIPPFAVVVIAGANTAGLVLVDKPLLDSSTHTLINSALSIQPGLPGICTPDGPVFVAYATADGTPLVGEEWGTKAGQWTIAAGKKGFRIVGGSQSGMVLANQLHEGGAITVREKDGTPSIEGVRTISFDQATGLTVEAVAGSPTEAVVKLFGMTVTRPTVTSVTCLNGVLTVVTEYRVFQNGRLVAIT